MVLMIDNYDSFVYNIVQYAGETGEKVIVYRNDEISLNKIQKLAPDKIIISPGPGRPEDAGLSCGIIEYFAGQLPILGVCLGHQCIGHVFGGRIVRAKNLMHGKTSKIFNSQGPIYNGLSNPFTATRYHSLIVERDTIPAILEIDAWTEEQEIMGIKHRDYNLFGVQFHPESILTDGGKMLIKNFLSIVSGR